jgi:hypothetical protein
MDSFMTQKEWKSVNNFSRIPNRCCSSCAHCDFDGEDLSCGQAKRETGDLMYVSNASICDKWIENKE